MLKGSVAIVTGASRGIGKSIALNLAKQGINIAFNYRDDSSSEAIDSLVKELQSYNVEALAVKCDVSDFDAVKSFIDEILNKFNKIDILINNAGITKDGLVIRMSESSFDDVLNVNLKGTFNMIRHVTPVMFKNKKGNIINISSVIGLIGNVGQANYAASKAGVIGLTKSVAREMALVNVNVNAICPGFIETQMTSTIPEKIKETMLANIPLKRLGNPEDIAGLVSFLISKDANYITGQVINVDGGLVM
jgi:3-oxoacyl-[acyl-carrier protein] reductase